MPRHYDLPTVSTREVTRLLSINLYTVYDMLRNGRLRGYKRRGRWYIYQTSVQVVLETPKI